MEIKNNNYIMDDKLNWDQIITDFNFLLSQKDVPQNVKFHAEGDVLTHTRLVCESLINLDEFKELDENEKRIVFLSAIFHDSAKPFCTREIYDEISSPGHALKGELFTREELYKNYNLYKIGFSEREEICKLVRYHGLPLFFLEKDNFLKYILLVSQMVKIKLLYILAKADILGRICSDKKELLDKIELFKEFCIENNCYYSSYQFKDEYSRFYYFNKDKDDPTYKAYDDLNFEVILMSGLPASGKDTWIQKNCLNLPMISLDNIREELNVLPSDEQGRVVMEGKERAKKLLRKKESFVWDATNITQTTRIQLISLFYSYGAKVKIIYIEAPYSEILIRNSNRKRSVPVNIINKMIKRLDVPNITEAPYVYRIV